MNVIELILYEELEYYLNLYMNNNQNVEKSVRDFMDFLVELEREVYNG